MDAQPPSEYTHTEKEKQLSVESSTKGSIDDEVSQTDAEPSRALVSRFGPLGPFLAKLFELGVEARGVERVPENQRDSTYFWNKCVLLWFLALYPSCRLTRQIFTYSIFMWW